MAILRLWNIQKLEKTGKGPFSTCIKRFKVQRSSYSNKTMSLEQYGQFKKNPRFFWKGQMSDGDMCKFSISLVEAENQYK